MKGDLSRNTYDRSRHYSSVRLQQGRIVTDADWNEQADVTRYRAETAARDTIGACGAPMDGAGYALTAETNALAVHAINAGVAWVAAEDGVLLLTTDGGAAWTAVDLSTSATIRALGEVGGIGWAVGDGGTVRKTTSQGGSWIAQGAGTLNDLRGVSVFDADHAWAVGDGGIVVGTADGGAHWSLAQTDAARLYAVHFVDELNGLAVGQGGVIVASTNGGLTWTVAASGTTRHLRALAAFGTSLAWACGQDGTIVRTTNAGLTWLPCNTPVSATLRAIGFRDNLEGWAAGDGGVLLYTVDGGANWSLADAGTTQTLRSLSFFGGEPGWVVGDASSALRIGAGSPPVGGIALPAVNLSIEPGRCYVGGILCELEARASYAHQPDGGADGRLGAGSWLLYLDAWQRHVSMLEDPAIREIALGGPDTATRVRTVAQVRALPLPTTSPAIDWNCDSALETWDALVNAPRPLLAARAKPQLAAANICEIAATAGYTRLENQLYRVEIHDGGANPTFKWSRENGSVAYAVVSVGIDTAQQQTTVRLAARGKDANLDLAVNDRVELLDDDADLVDRHGVFFEYLKDGDDALELVLDGVPPAGSAIGQDPSRHPILRRWDHQPTAAGTQVLSVVPQQWIELEDGVQVWFEPGGIYRPGDYWQIPARTISANVEWPVDDDGDPAPQPPAGIADAYCRLGIVEVADDGSVSVVADCRNLFPPLTEMEQLLYVSGDGQDAAPNALLPQPLAVRVARGSVPIAGRGVRFEVETGVGTVDGSAQVETVTDDDGQAQCDWTLGPAALAPGRFQRVRATLLDANGDALPGQIVVFCATATLSLQYVSGDGQQAQASTTLPHPLEVRVVDGTDGIAGVSLQATIEQGGGAIVGSGVITSDPQGQASIVWGLGASGPQRLRIDMLDGQGAVVQHLAFNATVAVPASGGCETTIGKGGQYPELDSDLLNRLIKEGGARVCICFLPGTHDVKGIEVDGGGQVRLSIHGCGQASMLQLGDVFALGGFETLEIGNLAIQAGGEASLQFQRIGDLKLASVAFDRSQNEAKTACLRITSAQRVSIDDCQIVGASQASVATVFEDLTGDCFVTRNRFVGIVSFYGDPTSIFSGGDAKAGLERLSRGFAAGGKKLLASLAKPALATEKLPMSLSFNGNRLSQMLISDVSIQQYQTFPFFQSASLSHNFFEMPSNLFFGLLTTVASNVFYSNGNLGAFIGSVVTVTGNMTPATSSEGPFGTLQISYELRVEQAANAMTINVFHF